MSEDDGLREAAVRIAGCRYDDGRGHGPAFCASHDDDGNPPWERCRWVPIANALAAARDDGMREATADLYESEVRMQTLTMEVAALRTQAAAVQRVRELHQAIDHEGYPAPEGESAYCAADGFLWPCQTSQALDGDQS